MIDPFTNPVTSGLIANLAAKMIENTAITVRRMFAGDREKENALKRCLKSAVAAFIASAAADNPKARGHLHSIFGQFFRDEGVQEELSMLMDEHRPDLKALAKALKSAGFVQKTAPTFKLEKALSAFEAAFIVAVDRENDLQGIVQVKQLRKQTGLQEDMRQELQKIHALLQRISDVSLEVRPGEIRGREREGDAALAFTFPEIKLEISGDQRRVKLGKRSVLIEGDVDNSDIITGNQNQVIRGSNIQGDVIGPGGTKVMGETEAERRQREIEAARKLYLQQLRLHCRRVDLETILGMPEPSRRLQLDDVYVNLDTTTRMDPKGRILTGTEKATSGKDDDEKSVPLPAMQAAGRFAKLLLLGDPGGGKSSLMKILCIQLANACLNGDAPPEGFQQDLLPVLISLRHLAPRLAKLPLEDLGIDEQVAQLRPVLKEQFLETLRRLDAEGFEEGLGEALRNGRCLLILDGLDEVPFEQRGRIRMAVQVLLTDIYPLKRVIITCRKNSYRENDFPGYEVLTLARFDKEKIDNFITAWYETQHQIGRVDALEKKEKTADLKEAVLKSDDDTLLNLAENPMMLTTMAMIHQKRTRLPRERVRVYKEAVDLLLIRWQEQKTGKDSVPVSPALKAFLQDPNRLRDTVELLAYETHRGGKDKKIVDLGYFEALQLLSRKVHLNDGRLALDFLTYIDQRSGLMVGQGGSDDSITFTFPHRTFQEYLAGCYLARRSDAVQRYGELAGEGPYWEIAVRFGMEEYRHNNRDRNTPRNNALLMIECADMSSAAGQRLVLWAGDIALRVLELGKGSHQHGEALDRKLCKRLREHLPGVLGGSLLPRERARAGRHLAALGDPRPGVTTLEGMQFCLVPAGPFWMGGEKYSDEKPLHNNPHLDDDYWMGRYPVTVGQFREYLEQSGRKPEDERSLKDPDNHPVRYVSWHEAWGFCYWLTKHWVQKGLLPEGWRVFLPSEAEWEKAARGGARVPAVPLIRSAGKLAEAVKGELIENPQPKREYPWEGGKLTPEHANYLETGLGTTSSVGCFPQGASPYGCEEMSGNVWEWTRSLWGKDWQNPDFRYPYDGTDGREELGAADEIRRVVRGGGFGYRPVFLRCADRLNSRPRGRGSNLGFRVAAAP